MNAHDSEKVVGTLVRQGYARVEDEAELILYNTCSIRDKAEHKDSYASDIHGFTKATPRPAKSFTLRVTKVRL